MTVCETCLLVGIAQGRLKVIQTIKNCYLMFIQCDIYKSCAV